MRDREVYGLIEKAKQDIGMRLGLLELISREALYQISALTSLIVTIPCIGYFFRKIMNKRIAVLKGVIQKKAGQGQKQDVNRLLEVQRRKRQRIDYKILMKLERDWRKVWRFFKKLNEGGKKDGKEKETKED